MPPLVSIVIPCYKGERHLAAAIESCLRQTHTDIEVIIVDDASPDACGRIAGEHAARDTRIRLLRHTTNRSAAEAFNTGFAVAKGEFMTRLAQDDLFREDALQIMLGCFSSNPQAGLVYCNTHAMHENGDVVACHAKAPPASALAHGNKVGLCAMWTRAVWEATGRFNPAFDSAEDYEYWCRIAEKFPLVHCREAPFFVRYHSAMDSAQRRAKQELMTAKVRARYAKDAATAAAALCEGWCEAGYIARSLGNRAEAIKAYGSALRHCPGDPRPWKGLVATLVGRRASIDPETPVPGK